MKALTIRQPWAWAILHGGKDVENRRWQTLYRGPLLVHAAVTCNEQDIAALRNRGIAVPDALPMGAFVGMVHLLDCRQNPPENTGWRIGRFYGWELVNPIPFPEPIPYRGRPGLFDVEGSPHAWVTRLNRQLSER